MPPYPMMSQNKLKSNSGEHRPSFTSSLLGVPVYHEDYAMQFSRNVVEKVCTVCRAALSWLFH